MSAMLMLLQPVSAGARTCPSSQRLVWWWARDPQEMLPLSSLLLEVDSGSQGGLDSSWRLRQFLAFSGSCHPFSSSFPSPSDSSHWQRLLFCRRQGAWRTLVY